MFFRSFSGSVGRVTIGAAVGVAIGLASLKVVEWSPAWIAAASQALGL